MNDAGRIYERLLVIRCQIGDRSAMTELIARYSPRVRFYLRKMAGDSVADDLLQDVWIDVFASIAQLKEPGAVSGWIYRIARHKAYAEITRRRPVNQSESIALQDLPDPEKDALSAEEADAVRSGLDTLTPEQREVLVLRFVEEMSYEQISQLLGCPLGTVRSRIHYAKRSLRAFIERNNLSQRGEHHEPRQSDSIVAS